MGEQVEGKELRPRTREVRPIIGCVKLANGDYSPIPDWPKGVTDMAEAAKQAAGIQTAEIVAGHAPSRIEFLRRLGCAEAEIKQVTKFRIA